MTWLRAEWDRFAAAVLIVAGAVALLFGYWGVAHARYTLDGLAFLVSGGLGGLFLLGLGATLLLSADLHDEWRKFDRIEAALTELADGRPLPPPLPAVPRTGNGPGPDAPAGAPSSDRAPEYQRPSPVLNRFGLFAVDAGIPAGRLARRLGSLGVFLAAVCLALGFWLTAQADDTRVGAGGVALAAIGVVVVAVVALTQLLRLRRSLRRRERRLFLPLIQR